MKKWILLLLAATMLSAANPDSKTEKEILSAMETFKQAMVKKDRAALAAVLSDDLTYTHSSNMNQDKAAVLASLQGKSVVESMDFKDPKVRVYGNTAVVTCDLDSKSNNAGTVTLSRLHVLLVWVKGPAGWQMVARQAARYPEPTTGEKK